MPNHYKDPITSSPETGGGNSRNSGDASAATKNLVVTAIESAASEYGLTQKDVANLLAIAKVESGFNPDAAASGSWTSASGVFQITDTTAADASKRLSGSDRINNVSLGAYNRFDTDSNVQYGIAVYLDKKARAQSDDVADIYKVWNTNPDEYNKYLQQLDNDSAAYQKALQNNTPIVVSTVEPSDTNTSDSDTTYAYAANGALSSCTNKWTSSDGSTSTDIVDYTASTTFQNEQTSTTSASGSVSYSISGNGLASTINNATLTLANNTLASVAGGGLTVVFGKSDSLNLTSAVGSTLNLAGSDTVTVAGTGLKINGDTAGNSVKFGQNASGTVAGNGGVISLGTGAAVTATGTSNQVDVTGSGTQLTASGEVVKTEANATGSVYGAGNTVAEGTNSTLVFYGNGNTTTLASGAYAGLNGTGEVVNANQNVIDLGASSSATVNGTGSTIGYYGSNATLTTSGNIVKDDFANSTGDVLNGSSNQISETTGSALSVYGNSDQATLAANATLSMSGTGETVTATGDSVIFAANTAGNVSGGNDQINLASGDTLIDTGSGNTLVESTKDSTSLTGNNNVVSETANGGDATSLIGQGSVVTGNSGNDLVNLGGVGTSATVSGNGGTVGICASGQTLNATQEFVNFSSAGDATTISGAADVINDWANGGANIALTGTNQIVNGDSGNDLVNLYGSVSATINGSGGTVGICSNDETLVATGENINFAATGYSTNIAGGSGDVINDVANGGENIALTGTNQVVNGDSGNDLVNIYGSGSATIYNNNPGAANRGTVGICSTGETLTAIGETVNFSAAGDSTTFAGGYDVINDVANSGALISISGVNQTVAGDTGNDVVNVFGSGSSVDLTSTGGTVGVMNSGETISAAGDRFNFFAANETVTVNGDGDTFGGTNGDLAIENLSSGGSVEEKWINGSAVFSDWTLPNGGGTQDGDSANPGESPPCPIAVA